MEKQLLLASYNGDVETARKALRSSPTLNLNYSEFLQDTALHVASSRGNVDIASLLLAHPAIDPNVKNEHGNTPFLMACLDGQDSSVRLLLRDSRVNPNEPSNEGKTPLYWAARWGHVDVVKWWVASGREIDLGIPGNEVTDAIGCGAKIKKKSYEDTEDFERRNRKLLDVHALLLRFKENPEETRREVRSELGVVDDGGFTVETPPKLTMDGYFAWLDSLPVHPSLIYFAAMEGNVEEAKNVIRQNPGVHPNWQDRDGYFALHFACVFGFDSLISMLLAHPLVEVNQKMSSGNTAFSTVSSVSCLRLLLQDSRVDVSEPNKNAATPLQEAASSGRLDILKWWIASGREMKGILTHAHLTVVTLLQKFLENPSQTRVEVRNELGITGLVSIHNLHFVSNLPCLPMIPRFPCFHPKTAHRGGICCFSG